MDLLLDVNIVVDICAQRSPFCSLSIKAFNKAENQQDRLWLYVGSVQTLQYVLAQQLVNSQISSSFGKALKDSSSILNQFEKGINWLSAEAEDGVDIFAENDPEDAQLLRAVKRLGEQAKILTRDELLINTSCGLAISPVDYLTL